VPHEDLPTPGPSMPKLTSTVDMSYEESTDADLHEACTSKNLYSPYQPQMNV